MPNPILPALTGVVTGTIAREGMMSPKAFVAFYVQIAKDCYVATGSKRVACAAATVVCGITLVPGPHQSSFITACAAAARGANKIK